MWVGEGHARKWGCRVQIQIEERRSLTEGELGTRKSTSLPGCSFSAECKSKLHTKCLLISLKFERAAIRRLLQMLPR